MAERSTPADALNTLPRLMDWNARNRAGVIANREKEFGIWQSWTWADARRHTVDFALGLMALGFKPGERMSVIGKNRPRLYWSMVSAQYAGGIPVPVYQDAVGDEMSYVLEHAGATFIICEDQEQVDKVLAEKDKLPELRQIIYLDPRGLRKYDKSIKSMDAVEELGREKRAELEPQMQAITEGQTGGDTCVMLYTSGTTGRSKGVVLSNDNVVESARRSAEFDNLVESDSVLAYLPMAWVGDFIFSVGQSLVTGFCVSCPESPDTMQHDLREIGPTYFFAPPRFFEGLLTNVMIRMEDAGPFKKRMFRKYMDVAKRVGGKILDGEDVSGGDKFSYWLGEKFIYGPLKNSLGLSNVRVGYTAGEAIGPEIFDFYRSLGINLKQLYGQTEATVFVTGQPDGQVRADTVGVAYPGVEIKVDDSGEVLYRSVGVFQEYYKNPEATAETKDAEGWVKTGDAGFVESDTGHLRIIDRAKDVGKMANGSLFAPKYVENKLKFYPNILEAVVFGDGRDTCTAMLNIDLNAVGNWAERNNIAYSSYMELAQHPEVYAQMQAHVEEVNRSIAEDEMLSGCQVHRFVVLHKQLDADDGEITRTGKVRRRIVNERFGPVIDALYDGSGEVRSEIEVTYEDGRKGVVAATLIIRDVAVATPKQKAEAA